MCGATRLSDVKGDVCGDVCTTSAVAREYADGNCEQQAKEQANMGLAKQRATALVLASHVHKWICPMESTSANRCLMAAFACANCCTVIRSGKQYSLTWFAICHAQHPYMHP